MFLPKLAFCQPQTFSIEGDTAVWALNQYLQVAELPDDELGIADLTGDAWNSRFLPFLDFVKNYPHGDIEKVLLDPKKIYWWRIKLQNKLDAPIKDWVLYTGHGNFIEVYTVDEKGQPLNTQYTGVLTPAPVKDFEHGNNQAERVRFSLPKDSSIILYGKVKVLDYKRAYIKVKLRRIDFYQSWDYVVKSRYEWAFMGFLISYILLNLLLYSSTLDRVFLWHALFQGGIFIYLLEFFNVLADSPLVSDHPRMLVYVVYSALCIMDMSCFQFIRYYMVMKKSRPDWDRRFKLFVWIRLGFAIIILSAYTITSNGRMTDMVTALFMVLEYCGVIALLIWLFWKTDQRAIFLIGGTTFFMAGVVLNALNILKGVGLRFSFTQIGVVGEVALFTLGLGFRMTALHKEKRKALVFKDLDEFKSKFYTNITHEFRTPLTVILGMAEQLDAAGLQTVSSQKNKVELIQRNGKQLLRLINQLLDLSKVQSGKLQLNLVQADIAAFLRYLVDSFHSFAASKDIRLRFLSEIDQLNMDFDEEKIQDVMTNLISNAIKFTPNGGEIVVRLGRTKENMLSIQVEDNGAGIVEEALPHIFDRFFSAKDTGNYAGGTGIGLALTKELIELMSGEINVESKYGEWTRFGIHLPISNNAELADRLEVPTQLAEPTAERFFMPTAEHSVFRLNSEEDEKPICLVIDDSMDIVRYLQMLLEPVYIVAVAYDGKRGIEKALELLPDVIISDIMMPEKDGLEVCDFLKNDERTSHIPIILLTAKATVADRIEGLRRGADAYLQKPFNQEELFIRLEKSVEARRRLVTYFSKMANMSSSEPAPELDIEIEDAFFRKAKAVVEENLADEDFDIHRLCRDLTLSRAQLHRKISALTGMSASHFIRAIRLQKAKEMLQTTDLSISEVAYDVGFRDPNYFSRTFAEEFGFPPSETRK